MNQNRQPDDPEVLAAVLKKFADRSREEWLSRLRAYPDFDESWVGEVEPAAPQIPVSHQSTQRHSVRPTGEIAKSKSGKVVTRKRGVAKAASKA